jgi:hypothetical protein
MKRTIKRLIEVALINPKKPKLERQDSEVTSFIPMENVCDINGVVAKLIERPFQR